MQENKAIVEALYKALAQGQTETVAKVLATDLEWWFHGPPKCQHMMKVLTGDSGHVGFKFEPRSVTEIGDYCVIAEGWEGAQAYWVHVWTIKDGLITQFREYFNTWLTVRDLKPLGWKESKSFTMTRKTRRLGVMAQSIPLLLPESSQTTRDCYGSVALLTNPLLLSPKMGSELREVRKMDDSDGVNKTKHLSNASHTGLLAL
ncbi:hypothetical protein ACLB2K_060640 [Fragaria x ananassa]